MKRLFLTLLAASLLALPVFAQPETEAQKVKESEGVTEHGFWAWANFLLLAAGLGYLIKKNAGPFFDARSRQIRQSLVEAQEARAEAEARVAEVDRRLANLGAEIEDLRTRAHSEAEAEGERARNEAARELAKIKSNLIEEIAAAAKAARLDLRRHAGELALSLAERKIAARMSPQVQDRLVRTFVARLEQPAERP